MRIVALLATYNEERFLAACIEHLRAQGAEAYVIDNESTDGTLEIARRYEGDGVMGIETLPRGDVFDWDAVLTRKEQLSAELDADWFIHHDADEFRVSPRPGHTLADELAEADAAGDSTVNFMEFTFVPCAEEPDHDHGRFLETMRWYYPLLPFFPYRLNAWKRQDRPVDLRGTGGHVVRFEGARMSPRSLSLRHYLCLSPQHAIEKYVDKQYSALEVAKGYHGWRAAIRPDQIAFPPAAELRLYRGDIWLDASSPRRREIFDDVVVAA